jgi:hypothetical protein
MSAPRERVLVTMLVVLAASPAAPAGSLRRTFQVGATVLTGARVSVQAVADVGSIEVRTVGIRCAPAALLVDGRVLPLKKTRVVLPASEGGEGVVTLVW